MKQSLIYCVLNLKERGPKPPKSMVILSLKIKVSSFIFPPISHLFVENSSENPADLSHDTLAAQLRARDLELKALKTDLEIKGHSFILSFVFVFLLFFDADAFRKPDHAHSQQSQHL